MLIFPSSGDRLATDGSDSSLVDGGLETPSPVGSQVMSSKPQPACPVCGGHGIPIAYGLPMMEAAEAEKRGEVVLGGCAVTAEDPDHRCRECGHEWIADSRSAAPL